MKKPGLFTAVLLSFFLTASLVIIFFLGWKLSGLSFVPFDVFDWSSRLLPGALITFGIDSMVKIIRFLNLGTNTAVAAKTAEQSMAVLLFLIAGIVAGTLIFSLLNKWKKSRIIPGLIFGIVFSLLIVLIQFNLNRSGIANELWVLAAFMLWGSILGWTNYRMMIISNTNKETGAVKRLDRRRFLIRLGSASAVLVVTGAIVDILAGKKQQSLSGNERWSALHELPNANAGVKPAPGTRPEFTSLEKHYRIDITTNPPVINEENWRLKISGMVEQPLELSLPQIQNYEPLNQFITLSCISNPVGGDLTGTTRWTGISLQQLLPHLKLKPSAAYLQIHSADGFFETVPIDLINKERRIMLTYAWDGLPLSTEHGFPLRIYIPDHYGMKQPKWIESIEVTDQFEAGYWVVRGWDKEAIMKATSVIDTIAVKEVITTAEGKKLIPVGGIAHAGDRGISRVELRIDDGEWLETKLRTPLSDLTWVVWRYDMPFREGAHRLTVRCYDGNGTPQIITPAPPHPSGASGLNNRTWKI